MKKNEEYFQDRKPLVERKSYESPNLIDLGKMKRITLGKTASGVDNLTPGDFE